MISNDPSNIPSPLEPSTITATGVFNPTQPIDGQTTCTNPIHIQPVLDDIHKFTISFKNCPQCGARCRVIKMH